MELNDIKKRIEKLERLKESVEESYKIGKEKIKNETREVNVLKEEYVKQLFSFKEGEECFFHKRKSCYIDHKNVRDVEFLAPCKIIKITCSDSLVNRWMEFVNIDVEYENEYEIEGKVYKEKVSEYLRCYDFNGKSYFNNFLYLVKK